MRSTLFVPHTGLLVSTRVLGTGMFGTQWGHGVDPTESRRLCDSSLEAGSNVLDTADTYQCGASESLLGACVHATREDLILASKYSLSARPHGGLAETGNNRKAPARSLEASLKRLHTDYLDLSLVRVPDGMTPIDDIMRGFDDLVRAGKILCARACPTFRPGGSRVPPRRPSGAAGCRSHTVWSSAHRSGRCCPWPRPSASARWPGRRGAAGC